MSCTFWLRRKKITAAKHKAEATEKAAAESQKAEAPKETKKAVKKAVPKNDNEGTV